MPLLVRTPAPFKDESLLGYVLRVSEENGYDTPWHVFQLAGLAQCEMRSPSLPPKKLAAILNHEARDLMELAYTSEEAAPAYKLLNHDLGRSAKDSFLRLQEPAFCPHCVQEKGYIEAFWDLSAAIACPEHHCSPISRCPACGESVRWFRPGLLRCRCGADLSEAGSISMTTATVELMGLLKAKLNRAPLEALSNTSGFPVAELDSTPLLALMRLLHTLGKRCLRSQGRSELDQRTSIITAGEVLSDWPRNYHQVLSDIGRLLAEDGLNGVGLSRQFNAFYNGLFARKALSEHVQFLKDEFVIFGLQHWGSAIIDPKLAPKPKQTEEARYISREEYARRYGLSDYKLKQMIADGVVSAKKVAAGKTHRIVIDLANTQPPADSEGIVTVREAAKIIGLPVSVLRHLRTCGAFEAKPRAGQAASWHIDDVKAFLMKGIALADMIDQEPPMISLSEVMRSKFRDANTKGDLVVAILHGHLRALGRKGDSFADLLLDKAEVQLFVRSKRRGAGTETCSIAEAALATGLDPTAVKPAVDLGLLDATERDGQTRVSIASIARLTSCYLSLACLAKELKTTTAKLLRICQEKGVKVQEVPRQNCNSPSRLILLAERDLLLEGWIAAQPRRSDAATSRSREAYELALRNYLRQLTEQGSLLPRRAGSPNKALIARACGFHRDVLYDHQNVVAVLDAHDQLERRLLTSEG